MSKARQVVGLFFLGADLGGSTPRTPLFAFFLEYSVEMVLVALFFLVGAALVGWRLYLRWRAPSSPGRSSERKGKEASKTPPLQATAEVGVETLEEGLENSQEATRRYHYKKKNEPLGVTFDEDPTIQEKNAPLSLNKTEEVHSPGASKRTEELRPPSASLGEDLHSSSPGGELNAAFSETKELRFSASFSGSVASLEASFEPLEKEEEFHDETLRDVTPIARKETVPLDLGHLRRSQGALPEIFAESAPAGQEKGSAEVDEVTTPLPPLVIKKISATPEKTPEMPLPPGPLAEALASARETEPTMTALPGEQVSQQVPVKDMTSTKARKDPETTAELGPATMEFLYKEEVALLDFQEQDEESSLPSDTEEDSLDLPRKRKGERQELCQNGEGQSFPLEIRHEEVDDEVDEDTVRLFRAPGEGSAVAVAEEPKELTSANTLRLRPPEQEDRDTLDVGLVQEESASPTEEELPASHLLSSPPDESPASLFDSPWLPLSTPNKTIQPLLLRPSPTMPIDLPGSPEGILADEERRELRHLNMTLSEGSTPGYAPGEEIRCPRCQTSYSPGAAFCSSPSCKKIPLFRLDEGRYEFFDKIASGGMADIFLVRDISSPQEEKVVKIIKAEVFDETGYVKYRPRFLREIRSLYRLSNHPHIVKIHDFFGEIENIGYYYAMEYLQGETLDRLIQRAAPLPLEQSLLIFSQICFALSACHAKNIIHRDLKPDNIFLVGSSEEPLVKLMDFGIIREIGLQRLTEVGTYVGTPLFMAPEQLLEETEGEAYEVGPPTDEYILALILYKMLSGRLPLKLEESQRSASKQMLQVYAACQHLNEEALPPSQGPPPRPDIAPFDQPLLRALAKKPGDRYPTIIDFQQAIARAYYAHHPPA